MNEIASIQNGSMGARYSTTRASSAARRDVAGKESTPPRDRVDLTEVAQNPTSPREISAGWDSRLAEIRARIDADTYITPDKLDTVVERLYEEITQ